MSRYDRGQEHPGIDRLRTLCGDDDARWAECSATADTALHTRVVLWDGIVQALENLPRPS